MTREMAGVTGGDEAVTGLEIAVIGMSGKFPGAKDIHEFWENLKNGIESISFFNDQELETAGVESQQLENPNYVKAFGIMEGIEYFDANFFGYTPREADVMDPQIRIFHECAWNALEDAGYYPDTYEGLIGIYAGAGAHPSWEFHAYLSGKANEIGGFAAIQFTDKDFLCTMVSYRFNLKGPAVVVQTACSTSLTAIHMACQAILGGECDMALAGGVNISMLQKSGHLYQEGIISSPDGHCRAFDAKSKGTIGGDGIGIVVLKRLENAAADNDYIYAIVKGSAINNDGVRKIGYSAPSIEGQAEVIVTAQEIAEVQPGSITYVETHGTGTDLGDPVEIDALKLAFDTDKIGYCAIGSVKTNMGHLNAAAGVTGFIKAVLALYHGQIPPSLHFESPNPKIDFKNSPFYVNTGLKEWKNPAYPLRAGVSSFGIGGTNAHVVLEEAPQSVIDENRKDSEYQLILLSAKTQSDLDRMTINLVNFLKENPGNPANPVNPGQNPGLNLADAAYTLQVGRKAFKYRRMLVCPTVEGAVEILSDPGSDRVYTHMKKNEQQDPPIIFMFPGQGAQYVDMGWELYQTEPIFQEEMDRCFEILKPIMADDIKEILYPNYRSNRSSSSYNSHQSIIDQTEIAQPLIFIIEYSLAKLLMNWGINPYAMIGHSIGEYAAACLSGVFSLEDALKLVAIRGQLMQQMPEGSMISVPLAENRLIPLLDSHGELSLAAMNSESHCVVSGPHDAIEAFARQLKENGHECRSLHTSHAFHSKMMEPMLKEFEARVTGLKLNEKADIPYISNVTGTWAGIKEAASPRYWATHIRNTVRFGDGISELLKNEAAIFVEVGPGRSLSTFVRHHENKKPAHKVIDLIRHPKEEVSDTYYLLNRVGLLWIYGKTVDWIGFHGDKKHRRIPLPTYPFKGQHYRLGKLSLEIDKDQVAAAGQQQILPTDQAPKTGKISDMTQWFYVPLWKPSLMVNQLEPQEQEGRCLVLANEDKLVSQLVKRLKQSNREAAVVKIGSEFGRLNDGEYSVNPQQENDYHELFRELKSANKIPHKIIHCWNVTVNENKSGNGVYDFYKLDQTQDLGFYSLLYLARAIGSQGSDNADDRIEIIVLTNWMQAVTGEEIPVPQKAMVRGAVQVIPREYPNITCRSIDIDYPLPNSTCQDQAKLIKNLLKNLETEIEINSDSPDIDVAYRNNLRWTPTFEQTPLEMTGSGVPILRERGVYLVTGGLGGIGLVLAEYLAKTVKACLILTGRSPFPGREQWDQWLNSHDTTDKTASKIRKIREMEASGAEVLIMSADAADMNQMQQVAARAEGQFGSINGIIHSAGLPDGGLIPTRTREMSETILAPKIKGTLVLDALFCSSRNKSELDFMVLCSSLSSVLAPVGQVAYCAANAFLDNFAYHKAGRNNTYTVSINWDTWQQVGMAVKAAEELTALDTGPSRKQLLTTDVISIDDQGRELEEVPEPVTYADTIKETLQEARQEALKDGLLPEEGIDVFRRVLAKKKWPQVLVSTTDLSQRIRDSRLSIANFHSEQLPAETGAIPQYPRPELSTPYVAPGTETQRLLARIWQQFLGIQTVGIHDDFFELGGDSLKVMAVTAKIHKELNVEIPLTKFFNRPTIKKLAQYVNIAGKHVYSTINPAEIKEYYPLSSAQKRLYMLQQMEPGSVLYNLTNAAVLEGDIRQNHLQDVFQQLINRHESFRTAFIILDGEVVQKVHDEKKFEIEYYSSLSGEEERSPLASQGKGEISSPIYTGTIIREFLRPFDLSQAPLLRVGLIETGKREHILMIDMHHIISDGTSIGLFLKDLMAIFGTRELPPLNIQYKDYSQWQNSERIRQSVITRGKYWLEEFKGKIPVSNLPIDFPRPDMQGFSGDSLIFTIESQDTRALKTIASKKEVSLFVLLLALLNVLISKLSGQDDILIGTQIAGRKYTELQHIIGLFLNTLVLRNYPNRDKTFSSFLEEVKNRTLKAFENQEYQFEDLVEKVLGKRELNRNPFFDVMFVWQNFEIEQIQVPGLTLKPYKDEIKHAALIDLSLYGKELGEELIFLFEYNTELFKKETIERFIKYLKEIISCVKANKEIKLKDIKISHDLGRAAPGIPREEDDDFGF